MGAVHPLRADRRDDLDPDRRVAAGFDQAPLPCSAKRQCAAALPRRGPLRPIEALRSEEHTSELQSLMRISYAVFCLKKKKNTLMHTSFQITHTDSIIYT